MSGYIKESCDSNEKDCYKKAKKAVDKPLLLFCGIGGNAQFTSPDDSPVNIGSLAVDVRSLSKPSVKIKFSSIVNIIANDVNAQIRLTFRLFRNCDDGEPLLLNNWIYEVFEIENMLNLRLSDSFTFNFCDTIGCFKSCDYFVEVSVDNLVNATVSVNNVQIQGIAEGSDSKSVLSCGSGNNIVFTSPTDPPATVGLVSIDTRDMKRPSIEIEFSSLVNLLGISDAQGTLNFRLLRSCENKEPVILNSWLYEVEEIETDNDNVRLSTSFSFIFCECLDCPKCCDYFVEVSISGSAQEIISLSVNNVHIAALAVESKECKKSALLSCGKGITGNFVNPDDPSIVVGRAIIDTRDIYNPKVSIEFSSTVHYLATDNTPPSEGRLQFDLFRCCCNKNTVLLNSWIYEAFQIEDDQDFFRFTQSFNFNFCDSFACDGCCEYFVEVSVENLVNAVLIVDNVQITALTQ